MSEIYNFKVHKADASIENGGLVVRLFYPENPEVFDKALQANTEYGIQVFQDLLDRGHSQIADESNPIKPASAGSIYVLSDGKIVCHRRDRFAPTHKMYHSAYAGFANTRESVYSAEGVVNTGLRESAEECLLVTNENKPWLVVPNDSKYYTLESARRLGLDLRPIYVDVEVVEPTDTLEAYSHDGNMIFRTKAFIEFLYESQTSINAMQIRRFPLSSEEVVPVDGEGMVKDEKFIHFNRESYVIDPAEIAELRFGEILRYPRVYQSRIKDGSVEIYSPRYVEPFLGPDKVAVVDPHIWAPEDLLCRVLDALGIGRYKGNWMQIELDKEKAKVEGKSLLPEHVLAR